jgi:hypothetical protein
MHTYFDWHPLSEKCLGIKYGEQVIFLLVLGHGMLLFPCQWFSFSSVATIVPNSTPLDEMI